MCVKAVSSANKWQIAVHSVMRVVGQRWWVGQKCSLTKRSGPSTELRDASLYVQPTWDRPMDFDTLSAACGVGCQNVFNRFGCDSWSKASLRSKKHARACFPLSIKKIKGSRDFTNNSS